MPGPESRHAARPYRAACVTLPMPRARPDLITASLHLEHVQAEALRDKVRWLMHVHAGSVCVTSVATRDNLPRLPMRRAVFLRIAASHGQSAAPEPCLGAS